MSLLAVIQVLLLLQTGLVVVALTFLLPPDGVSHALEVRLQRRHPELPLEAVQAMSAQVLRVYGQVALGALFVCALVTGGCIGAYRAGEGWSVWNILG